MKKVLSAVLAALMTSTVMSSMMMVSSAKTVTASTLKKLDYVCTKAVKEGTTQGGDRYTDTFEYTYDEEGNLIMSSNWGQIAEKKPSKKETVKYSYDSKGKMTKKLVNSSVEKSKTLFTYYSNGTLNEKISKDNDFNLKCKYDSKGNLTTDGHRTYTYDKNNNLIEEKYNLGSGIYYNAKSSVKYKYNKKNKRTKKVETKVNYMDDPAICVTRYSYDKKGNLIKEEYTDKRAGKCIQSWTIKYTYSSSGKLTKISKAEDYHGKKYETTTYSYNANGDLIKKVFSTKDSSGETLRKTTYNKYDDNGNLLKKVFKHKYSDGELETTTYNYSLDNNGNPIKKDCSFESWHSSYTTTTFTYEPAKKMEYEGNDGFLYSYNGAHAYTGKPVMPNICIYKDYSTGDSVTESFINDYTKKKMLLYPGHDYQLKYANNKETGTGKMIVHFIGDYYGKDDVVFPFTIMDITSLETPTSLKANSGASNVKLTWNKVFGAAKYRIYMYNDSTNKYEWKLSTSKNSAEITELKSENTYKFYVIAINYDGKIKSNKSKVVKATTKFDGPAVKASSSAKGKVKLLFDKVPGASGYDIYMSKSKSGTYKLIFSTKKKSVSLSDLTSGKAYYFKVKAYKTIPGGNKSYSVWSNKVSQKIK